MMLNPTNCKSVMPRLALLGWAVLTLLLPGCALERASVPAYTASGSAKINQMLPLKQGRREAIAKAEAQARDQIVVQAGKMPVGNGRTLDDLAVVDPFVRAKFLDTVRAAQIAGRTIGDNGIVTTTVRLNKAPLEAFLSDYQAKSAAAK